MSALWTEAELTDALEAPPSERLAKTVEGVSIDTRTLAPGDLFFAIRGETHDGHDHVARAFEAGASAAVVHWDRARDLAALGPVFAADETLKAMERLGVAARARTAGADRRRHRLGRQDERQGDAAGDARRERRNACLGGLLQQSLGRAADAFAPAGRRKIRRLRDRHEPRRRDHAACAHGPPACGADHHDRAGPYRISRLARSDRRRQGGDLSRPRAGRNRDPQSRRSPVRAARGGGARPRRARADLRRVGGLRRPAGRVRGKRGGLARLGQGFGPQPALRPRRAWSAHGGKRARRAARRRDARRRCRALRGRARRLFAAEGPGRKGNPRRARRSDHADRRELQRQSGLYARGAEAAGQRPTRAATGAASRSSATCWNSARTARRCTRRSPPTSR